MSDVSSNINNNNVTIRRYHVALIAQTEKQLRHSRVHTLIAEQLKDWLAGCSRFTQAASIGVRIVSDRTTVVPQVSGLPVTALRITEGPL